MKMQDELMEELDSEIVCVRDTDEDLGRDGQLIVSVRVCGFRLSPSKYNRTNLY